MKKTLYIIGGPMGVGKTAACRCLSELLPRCVLLDGDNCWDMHPFQVTDETKAMVMGNICFTLRSFLACSAFENVVFCWVLHEQGILDELLSRLDAQDHDVKLFSLVCGEKTLQTRLQKDVDAGLRQPDVIPRSLARLPLYEALGTVKLDTTDLTAGQTALRILAGG